MKSSKMQEILQMNQADKDKIIKDGQEYIFDFENTNAKLRQADDQGLKKE